MKVGITLPQFHDEAEPAVEAARLAEAAGLDGVFVFDHLWPIGHPERPALHGPTLLGAIAAETARISVGTLVARVGLVPDAVLVHQLATLHRIAGPRLIAGLGTGDHLSRPENDAYGVAFPPVAQRREAMVGVCRALRALGVEVWVGGRSPATAAIGRSEGVTLNLWQATAQEVAAEVDRKGATVSWGGQVDLSDDRREEMAPLLAALRQGGATWAVVAPIGMRWPGAVEAINSVMAAYGG